MKKHWWDFGSQFVKYVLVGGSAALLNWAVFYVCLEYGKLHYIIASIISFILATLWNFIIARVYIFHARNHSLAKESALVYMVSLGGLGIDMVVLFVCIEYGGLPAMLGKILATGVAFVFNFLARYKGIYR